MIDLDMSFFVQLVNFLISLVVLNFLIIRPIREVIKKRNDTMSGLVAEAEQFSDQAESKLKNYEAALAEARAAGTEERNKLKEEAASEEKQLLETAQKDAQQTMAETRSEVESQVKAAMEQLKSQVPAMAEKATAKVLG
jgi:F-type H+-transporting ATPase subunit b